MYTKDMDKHISVRLSPVEYEFLQYHADLCQMSISAYLRSIINTIRIKKLEVKVNENKQAGFDNKL